MNVIRIPEKICKQVQEHLFTREGEHFAYFLARWSESAGTLVFLVKDVILVPDEDVFISQDHWEVMPEGYLRAVNAAVQSGLCLIEMHNHIWPPPRFSATDRAGLAEFVPYIHQSLPGKPYAALVWTEEGIYGEYFLPNGKTGIINSIVVYGDRLQQLVSRDDDQVPISSEYDRQLAWFTPEGQRQIERLSVGIVGLGGTGSHVSQQLAYLGFQNYVLVDDDHIEDTNLNRLVIATEELLDMTKVAAAANFIQNIEPTSSVISLEQDLRTPAALDALKGVDILFGCIDNDGARQILNELAVSYRIPYFDVGVGIDASEGEVLAAGGYINVVLPDGPCLQCMNSIDQEEASYYLADETERQAQRERGYVTGMDVPAPAVISLNGLVASAAITELLSYISGSRPVAAQQLYDLLGTIRPLPGQWMAPSRVVRRTGCVHCALAGLGDEADVLRYSRRFISKSTELGEIPTH
ncbi:MAG: ThiF family adenylyltransferase [Chloroflexi bacterium]|nr:MAG: ThiF family adenylyltransferase [Chloroflexota bacterium]